MGVAFGACIYVGIYVGICIYIYYNYLYYIGDNMQLIMLFIMDSDVIQQEIIQEFDLLTSDMELTLRYLMEHGTRVPPIASADRIEQHLIPGCLSQVWVIVSADNKCVRLQAQSDAAITQGLVSLLVRCFDGQPLAEVANAKLFFPQKIGMQHFIGTQRSGGFAMMWQKIQQQTQQLLNVETRHARHTRHTRHT